MQTKPDVLGRELNTMLIERGFRLKSFSARNILYVVWFLVYFFIAWLVLGANLLSFQIVGVIYLVAIVLSFTPPVEAIMRFLNGARKIERADDWERLNPIFESVYEAALKVNPSIFKGIRLFIVESSDINAFALGRKTLAINRGAMDALPDEELYGLMAHEMGHFSNGDTMASLVMLAGNIMFSLLYSILKGIAKFFHFVFILNDIAIMRPIWWLISKIARAIQWIGDFILMPVSRENEFAADEFAFHCGYGQELNNMIEKLSSLYEEKPWEFQDYIKSTHPPLAVRDYKLFILLNPEYDVRPTK